MCSSHGRRATSGNFEPKLGSLDDPFFGDASRQCSTRKRLSLLGLIEMEKVSKDKGLQTTTVREIHVHVLSPSSEQFFINFLQPNFAVLRCSNGRHSVLMFD